MISAIEGHKVGMVFVEQSNNHVKISWRAIDPKVDVSPIAKHFQGGGHAAAAGADIEGELEAVQKEVLKKTREMLNL
jgi:bifunctional oligoribonuclease and PAP phosphatase NrnA